mgnify:CR=1 FL=1
MKSEIFTLKTVIYKQNILFMQEGMVILKIFSSAVIILVLLLSSFQILSLPIKAESSETIYIRADGRIDPPDAPIVTYDNVTYTLTDNIVGSIAIERDYIILDGAGYTLRGEGDDRGVWSGSAVYVTIKNMHITGFSKGIAVSNRAGFWVITNNIIINNDVGISIYYLTHNNTIVGNYIANRNSGIQISDSAGNIVINNTITGSTVGIWLSSVFGTGSNIIIGNSIVDNEYGVFIYNSNDNIFYHNNFILNTIQVSSSEAVNAWDDGNEGNYWTDYNGTDLDDNGIGDTPHILNENNLDHYPLMQPWPAPWKDWNHYHSYSEIVDTLLFLNRTYPNIVEVYSIGRSWQGRDIYCIRLTNESNSHPKPEVLFVGYHHARELISAELPLYFAVYTVTNFGINKTLTRLLNYSEIYIIPALNVDGFEAVAQNDWQRKNVHPFDEDGDGLLDEDPPDDEDGDGYIEYLFYSDGVNYYFIRWEGIDDDGDGIYNEDWIGGVDLNRNYGYQWNASAQSGSPNPQDEDYRGPSPFSEPETRAIRDFVMQHNIKYAISFHSGAECIVYPWGYTDQPPPDENTFIEIAQHISEMTGVWYEQSGKWYTTSGVWDDWMYGNQSIFAFTCEIYQNDSAWHYEPGPEPNTWWERGILEYFNPNPSRIETVIQRWLPVFVYITDRAIREAYDIALLSVTPLKTIVGQGFLAEINVTILNEGSFEETFNLIIYANNTEMEVKSITLRANSTATFFFTCNTTGLDRGEYILQVYIQPIPGEVDVDDNFFTDGYFKVTVPGDVNGDELVDVYDLILVASAFGEHRGTPQYSFKADINSDGVIDIYDLILVASHYGASE